MQSPVYILDGGTAEKQRISAMVLLLFPFVVAAASVTSMPIFNWVVWIAGVLLAVGFVAGVLRSTGAIPKELFLFYAFAGWSTLGVINAVAPELLLSKLFTVLQLGVLVGIVSHYSSNSRMLKIVLTAILLGVLLAAVSGYLSGEYQKVQGGMARITGMGMNSNTFSVNLVFGSAILLYFLKVWRSLFGKLMALFMLLGLAVLIVASGSRTGFFCYLFLLLVWMSLVYARDIRRYPGAFFIGLAVVGLLGLVLYYAMSGTLLAKKLTTITTERSSVYRERSATVRFGFYGEAAGLVAEHPVVGIGLNNFIAHSRIQRYAHSNYLEVFTGAGIPGGLIYYSMFLILGLRLRRLRKRYEADPQQLALIRLGQTILLVWLLADFASVTYYDKLTWIIGAAFMGWSCRTEVELVRPQADPTVQFPQYPLVTSGHGYPDAQHAW